jgi:LmbE family N-acetylglucosaminyl deacetylase
MATLVLFHAHPDDEAIATGGTVARAVAEGHRAVLVFATRGELGEVPVALGASETLGDRRVTETLRAAEILGAERVEFLGYHDSGMAGDAANDEPSSFWRADVDEAAGRLATILDEEQADVLTTYDEFGGYGHPDHVQVHQVGIRAGALAGTPRVYEATMSREHIMDLIRRWREQRPQDVPDDLPEADDFAGEFVEAARITTTVDIREFVGRKRAAMAAHASQIADDSFFLTMPEDIFVEAFGWEWFVRRGVAPATRETWLLG